MKVAVVTDDGKTISPHFGMAQSYLVYDIENGAVKGKEMRPKAGHRQGGMEHLGGTERHSLGSGHHQGPEETSTHQSMLSNVRDCAALIARGMGWGMHDAIIQSGIKPFVTESVYADDAVQAYIKGSLDDHREKLH
ncbi:MAG: NifB/NifX family molybdenum-iron cluster-binding protein [Nitrososphaerales archaeon]|jgi:predicted Fe-Mo cluster-binding NifX family protein